MAGIMTPAQAAKLADAIAWPAGETTPAAIASSSLTVVPINIIDTAERQEVQDALTALENKLNAVIALLGAMELEPA